MPMESCCKVEPLAASEVSVDAHLLVASCSSLPTASSCEAKGANEAQRLQRL